MNDDWLILGCAILAIMLALVGIVLPEPNSFPSNYPYANLTGVPSTFPYGNLTGIPNTFPYSNVTGIPNNYPYGNLTDIPQSFPYGNLTGIPSTFPYGNLTGVPNIDLMHGLGLWLPFDNVALDKSGYRNDGTVYGALWVDGKYWKALNFDGANDYVDCGSGALLDNLQEITVSLWLKRDVLGMRHMFLSKGAWYFGIQADNRLEATVAYNTQNAISWSTSTIPIDSYLNVVVTYSGNGDRKIHLYVNSVEVAYDRQDVSVGSRITDALDGLWVGNHYGGGIPFDGIIDEVRVYNRCLNQAEITALYNLP